MLVAPRVSYPGVYIQEVPSDVRTIVGVDTATTAFIGRAIRGPVDQPVVINNFGDFERIFGGLWLQSTLGYSVQSFFLNGGAKAVIVRSFRNIIDDVIDAIMVAATTEGATKDTVKDAAAAKAQSFDSTPALTAFLEAFNAAVDDDVDFTMAAQKNAPKVKAQLSLNRARIAAQTVAQAARRSAMRGGATIDDVKNASKEAADTFTGLGDLETAAQSIKSAVDGATLDNVKKSDFFDTLLEEAILGDSLQLEAIDEGQWGNRLRARVEWVPDIVRDSLGARFPDIDKDDWFTLTIHDSVSGVTETFANVTTGEGPRNVANVLSNSSDLVRMVGAAPTDVLIPHPAPLADPPWTDDLATTTVAPSGQAFDADPPDATTIVGSLAEKTGIYALEDTNIFNLLCIPPYQGTDVNDMKPVHPDVWSNAAKYCTDQRAMLIVDAPSDWDSVDDAVNAMPLIAPSANAAIYFPQVTIANRLRDNQIETFAPGGAIAGIMARTDASRGVWKAPAGQDARLNGVVALNVPLTDDENGALNPLGVNCLRLRPAAGNVIWGARTLVGDDRLASQWKYVPVRRTALYIEETLYRNIQWAVFEPNDEPLWAQLRLNIGVFMNGLFRQGAFQGQSAKDAYFVKCDSTTTTQADIDKGIVNVVVGFAPLKPAEFVVIYLKQIAGQLAT